jgi:hypothetical protein
LDAAVSVYDVAEALPGIRILRQRCRALAMLEAVASPDWESRYYSFAAEWGGGWQFATMRSGSGEEYDIVFTASGVFIRGLDHESPMSPGGNDDELWPGLLDGLPDALLSVADGPAFNVNGVLDATFCLWRLADDPGWGTGRVALPAVRGNRTDPDGAGMLDILCDPTPRTYLAFAADIHGRNLPEPAATHVYALRPLDTATVAALNPDLTLDDLREEVAGIGYPCAGPRTR